MTEQGRGAVVVSRRGAVAILTLNEPKSLNALSPAIKSALEESLPALLTDGEVRAIVVTGEGRGFCAGGDVRAMEERRAVATRERMRRNYRWLVPLITADKPVIAAVNGLTVGAGLSLALTADVVVAARSARFKAGFRGIGAVPDLGVAYALPRAVGMLRAKDLLFSNREIGAEEAQAIGLVSVVAEPEALMDKALAIAEDLAAGPTISFGLTKQLLQRGYHLPLETFLEAEGLAQATAFNSADFAEGVEAFRAKRPPDFHGR